MKLPYPQGAWGGGGGQRGAGRWEAQVEEAGKIFSNQICITSHQIPN